MKIERQQLKQTQTTMVPKSATSSSSSKHMSNIDNDWNDFLMVRGCNWESLTEDDANNANKRCKKKKIMEATVIIMIKTMEATVVMIKTMKYTKNIIM